MLIKRILTAVVGIIYLILILYLNGWIFDLSILLFALVALSEFYHALSMKGYHPLKWFGYFFVSLFYFLYLLDLEVYFIVTLILMALGILSIQVFLNDINIDDIAVTVLGIVYPGLTFLSLILLEGRVEPYGYYLLILAFFTTWATDTFAYFVGLKFGKNPLCPKISPKKTIEGSVGGLLGSIIVSGIVGLIFTNYLGINLKIHHFLFIGLLSGIFSQIGDLLASAIKRNCGIKDFGKILPGHGGLMDRFDSLLFTASVIYCYYLLFLAS